MKNFKTHISIIGMLFFVLICVSGIWACQAAYGAAEGLKATVTAANPGDAPESGTGWSQDGNYYYDNWTKASGFRTLDNQLYYFDPSDGCKKKTSGHLEQDEKFYQFAATGIATLYTGPYEKYYYSDGVKSAGFKTVDGKLYYYSPETKEKKTKGYKTYKGKLYKFKSSGVASAYSGVYKAYYYKKGTKQTKNRGVIKKMNNGKIYYFKKNGKVSFSSSWRTYKGNKYYFRKGVGLKGWKYVGKYKYYFSSKGVLCKDLIKRFGSKWKKKNLLIKVNRRQNCITLYAKDGKNGYVIPVKSIVCSVGKAQTPTVKGTYYVNKARTYRWGKLGGPTMGGYCYGQYCSRIVGGYLFHSITYSKPNKYTMSSTAYNMLGRPASHGCIRLQTKNAKLIYDIARYRKTKVIIYDGKSPGPLGKPSIGKVRPGQNYDPTDPNI